MSLIRYNLNSADPYSIELFESAHGKVPFEDWFVGLRDEKTKAVIRKRLDRLCLGNFGDHRHIREGVYELRIDYGPGFRIYYAHADKKIILLLVGGNKSSQRRDIEIAVTYWKAQRNTNNG